MGNWEIRAERIEVIGARFQHAPRLVGDWIEKTLRSASFKIMGTERRVLKVVRYTGELEGSVSTEYEATPPIYRMRIGPTAKHAIYVLTGTRPHWAPLAPLATWAMWKLGNAKFGFAVRASIAHHGTGTYIERRGLGDGHGGYNFVARTLQDRGVQSQLRYTRQRIPVELIEFLQDGKMPNPAEASTGE